MSPTSKETGPGSTRPVEAGFGGIRARYAAFSGFVAGAAGIASAEVLAGLIPGVPSPIIAVGSLIIDLQPRGAKDLMTSLFGTNDKTALNVAVLVVGLLVAAILGLVARRDMGAALTGFGAFGALSVAGAVFAELISWPLALLSAGAAVLVAVLTLWMLLVRAARVGTEADAEWGRYEEETAGAGVATRPASGAAKPTASRAASTATNPAAASGAASRADRRDEPPANPFRRQFLIRGVGILAAAAVAGSLGRYLLTKAHPAGVPVNAKLPAPSETVPPLAADEQLSAPGLTPLVVSNGDFYRIDTALLVPEIDASTWQLNISGMVGKPHVYTYNDLAAMPLFEQYVTLACVSNEVGGGLVGNALWSGVRLKDILAAAQVQSGATQIVGRAVDGFTVGFPTSWAMDPSREPMIALGMNGQPLPAEHGYPARLIVPGLYGYVSATKWLSEIQLTTREAFDGYWVPLGWAKDAPILTQSRIDHPHDTDQITAGPQWIDGVAWAPDRGIVKVELSIDGGPWTPTEVSRPISKATWVQWMLQWDAKPGGHTIEVRATDGTGQVQTSDQTSPAPDGARGHQKIGVTVR